jgi:Ca-activated chloride channel family protein
LVDKLSPTDTLGIVAYAGTERVVLQPTAVENKSEILDALDGLTHGGSTNGEAGIKRAYALARSAFVEGGINRVVLCTDGDFNVGLTGDPLLNLIEEYRDQGVYLTTLGFGMGNYNDSTMEQLADRGNGNYAYIDSQNEALRVLGEKLVSTLSVIAKDVKLQVEFNPRAVTRYRLVGYENRVLENEDFIDDTVDAGEIGAGHRVTAFYELEWATDLPLAARSAAATLKIRYKEPDSTESTEHRFDYQSADHAPNFPSASPAFRFAAAVTEFAEILRQSPHSLGADFSQVLSIAEGALTDPSPIETEFLTLVSKASEISRRAGSR